MYPPTETAKMLVAQYFNRKAGPNGEKLGEDDVYVVWFCYILGGWKALVSTTVPDNMYYEVTHNKDKGETYLDAYGKLDNVVIPDANGN
jgi:hypothetical protein